MVHADQLDYRHTVGIEPSIAWAAAAAADAVPVHPGVHRLLRYAIGYS